MLKHDSVYGSLACSCIFTYYSHGNKRENWEEKNGNEKEHESKQKGRQEGKDTGMKAIEGKDKTPITREQAEVRKGCTTPGDPLTHLVNLHCQPGIMPKRKRQEQGGEGEGGDIKSLLPLLPITAPSPPPFTFTRSKQHEKIHQKIQFQTRTQITQRTS